MARVALGGSVRNSVEVCKGATWYEQNLCCPRGIPPDVRTLPSQVVGTSFPPAELTPGS